MIPLERRLRMTLEKSVDFPIPGGPVTSQMLLRLAKGEAVFKMRLKAFQTHEGLAAKDCRGKDEPLRSQCESYDERAAHHSLLLQSRGERKQGYLCRYHRGGRWQDVLRLSRWSGSERCQGGERTLASDECHDGRLQCSSAEGGREERQGELLEEV